MASVAIVDPITNPIGFMIYFFLSNDLYDPTGIVKIAFFMSVLVYPILLLGWYLNPKITDTLEKTIKARFIIYFLTTFLCVIAFWLFMRLWYILLDPKNMGLSFTPLGLLQAVVVISVLSYPFVLLGNFLLKKMKQVWKMPDFITLYIIDIAMCLAAWLVIWGYFLSKA